MSVLAQGGQCRKTQSMSLLGVKRTWLVAAYMSAYDPKRTWVRPETDPPSRAGFSRFKYPLLTVHNLRTKDASSKQTSLNFSKADTNYWPTPPDARPLAALQQGKITFGCGVRWIRSTQPPTPSHDYRSVSR